MYYEKTQRSSPSVVGGCLGWELSLVDDSFPFFLSFHIFSLVITLRVTSCRVKPFTGGHLINDRLSNSAGTQIGRRITQGSRPSVVGGCLGLENPWPADCRRHRSPRCASVFASQVRECTAPFSATRFADRANPCPILLHEPFQLLSYYTGIRIQLHCPLLRCDRASKENNR